MRWPRPGPVGIRRRRGEEVQCGNFEFRERATRPFTGLFIIAVLAYNDTASQRMMRSTAAHNNILRVRYCNI